MATRDSSTVPAPSVSEKLLSRVLLEYQFVVYSAIVARKHGIPAPLHAELVGEVPETELRSIVEALRDMAHLPPA